MKLERNLIPIVAIAAIILLVVPAVGMVIGMAVASEPGDETTAATEEPELPPLELPPLPDKNYELVDSKPQQTNNVSRADAYDVSSVQGTVYSYKDGDRTIGVTLQEGLVLQKNSSISSNDTVIIKGSVQSIISKGSGGGQGGLPVFRSESGGGLMTLPGGIMLGLNPEWDKAQVDSFFSNNGISPEQVSELGFIPNGFLVNTDPGFPSLELANELAEQEGVDISSPNWWTEVEAK